MAKKRIEIEPTEADFEAVRRRLEEEDPREQLMYTLARHEAEARLARERAAQPPSLFHRILRLGRA